MNFRNQIFLTRPRQAWVSALAGILSWLAAIPSQAAVGETNSVVSPPQFANEFSLGPGHATVPQQQYSAKVFEAAPNNLLLLTGVAFRIDEEARFNYNYISPRIEIELSTAARPLSQMSWQEFQNWGQDRTTVYQQSEIRIIAQSGRPASAFDLVFTFSKPFGYDRAAGDLVMAFSGVPIRTQGGLLDVIPLDLAGDLSPPGYSRYVVGGIGVPPANGGLVTTFFYTVLPEPSVASTFLAGLFLTSVWHHLRKHS
jgi:hypothetical protein